MLAPLLAVEVELELELVLDEVEEVVPFGFPLTVAPDVATPVAFLQTPLAGPEAVLLKEISAQLYSPPLGSPFVMTWIVAFMPSILDGIVKPVMQNAPRPCSEKVGRRMVLKAEPTLLP